MQYCGVVIKICGIKSAFLEQRKANYHQRGVMLIDAKQTVTCKMTQLKMRVSFAHLTRLKNHLV